MSRAVSAEPGLGAGLGADVAFCGLMADDVAHAAMRRLKGSGSLRNEVVVVAMKKAADGADSR